MRSRSAGCGASGASISPSSPGGRPTTIARYSLRTVLFWNWCDRCRCAAVCFAKSRAPLVPFAELLLDARLRRVDRQALLPAVRRRLTEPVVQLQALLVFLDEREALAVEGRVVIRIDVQRGFVLVRRVVVPPRLRQRV